LYHKGEYDKAINEITKAISFFKWLECNPKKVPGFGSFRRDMKKEEEEPDYNPDEEEIKEMKEKLEKEREDDEFPVTEEEVNIALGK
jgi:hypothetical protein